MKVRIVISIAGFAPGAIVDTDETPDALAWATVPLETGDYRAEVLDDVETAMRPGAPERATRGRGRARG